MNVEEIERSVPAPDELLVKVYASDVNPVDWVIRQGANDNLRPFLTLPMTLGWDAAGVVEEIGSEEPGFKKVMLSSDRGPGGVGGAVGRAGHQSRRAVVGDG